MAHPTDKNARNESLAEVQTRINSLTHRERDLRERTAALTYVVALIWHDLEPHRRARVRKGVDKLLSGECCFTAGATSDFATHLLAMLDGLTSSPCVSFDDRIDRILGDI